MSLQYGTFLALLPLVSCLGMGDSDSHLQTPLVEFSESTYLKVIFPGGDEEYVRNWECREGIWAEDMYFKRQPNCVCVKGVYAIGTDLCDTKFKIITGDDHCFDVRGQVIRKFIPLTGQRGFDGKANTVFRADAPYFARLNSPTPTTSVGETVHYLFRMNDPGDISTYARFSNGQAARLKCFPGQKLPEDFIENPIMQIVKLPNCSNEFRGPKEWCDESGNLGNYQWTLNLGQSWSQKGEIGNGDKYPSNCASGNARQGRRQKRWAQLKVVTKSSPALKRSIDVEPEKEKCDKFDPSLIENKEFDTPADHFFQPDPVKQRPKFHSIATHQKIVNMQNRRVGHHIRKFYMDGDKGMQNIPRFNEFEEFKYVQSSKEILKAVCPSEFVSPVVVDFLIRTFRLLYIDSTPEYIYPINFNENEHKRIMETLTKCKDEAKPIEFIKDTSCPDSGILATNQSLNDSTYFVYDLKKSSMMPGDLMFNVSSMDVAVELVWKITMLTHYYCWDYYANPFDFSGFFVRMEALLKNPTILFRWYYPGQFNTLLQFFLMSHDLRKFANAVDRCVETVYARSVFKHWMKRPTEMLEWVSKVKNLPHDVSKSFNSPTANFGKSRKKRFYLQDDMWQKQGYCMHNTDAPYTEVRTSTFLSCKKKPVWFDNTD